MIKNKNDFKGINKEQIIAEYLSKDNTLKSLGIKYGIADRTIQSWVRAYRKSLPVADKNFKQQTPKEKELQTELHRLELKNQLLEEILKLSEEQTGINLRKKYGTKQS
jgi:transposase-like protein